MKNHLNVPIINWMQKLVLYETKAVMSSFKSRLKTLLSFSLQRLNCLFDHCTYVHCFAVLLICCLSFLKMS